MKTLSTMACAALFALGLASQASAYPLTGTTTLTKSGITIGCTAVLTLSGTWPGGGAINPVKFTAGSALCSSLAGLGLPWTLTPSGATYSLSNISLTSPLGTCGPSTITGVLSGSVLTFTSQPMAGGCTFSASLS
ncbi:MAG: hypothetical protein P4L64_11980 [Caulobacteraceae bacterium]|nr:hypothetical protein [Caulobacteraceae bacterium]